MDEISAMLLDVDDQMRLMHNICDVNSIKHAIVFTAGAVLLSAIPHYCTYRRLDVLTREDVAVLYALVVFSAFSRVLL